MGGVLCRVLYRGLIGVDDADAAVGGGGDRASLCALAHDVSHLWRRQRRLGAGGRRPRALLRHPHRESPGLSRRRRRSSGSSSSSGSASRRSSSSLGQQQQQWKHEISAAGASPCPCPGASGTGRSERAHCHGGRRWYRSAARDLKLYHTHEYIRCGVSI